MKGVHRILDKFGVIGKNVSNDIIVSHKLGHCDLFSHRSLIKVPYNGQGQFHIFLSFVGPKNSILPKIAVFTCFSKMKHVFLFHMERNPALDISFVLTTLVTIIVKMLK